MRVVTTLPAATELVATLGVDPVGVSHACDHPPRVTDRPTVTRSRIDAAGSSADIDRQVLAFDESDGPFSIDAAAIDRLDPDVIVTQGVCDVCAIDAGTVERDLDRIDADPTIVTIDSHTVDGVVDDLERLGTVLGRQQEAATVREELEGRLQRLRSKTATVSADERPRTVVFDWMDPVMVAAHWVPELVRTAGGRYDLAESGTAARPREWDEILAYDPEAIVVAPCGFDLDQTAANARNLWDRPGWEDLTAVRDGRIWAIDGDGFVNRPGPRVVDAAELFGRLFHPAAVGDVREHPAAEAVRSFPVGSADRA